MSERIESLMAAAAGGDSDATGRLIQLYRPYLSLVSNQLLPDVLNRRCDSSDIVQHVCADAIAALHRFRGRTEPEFTSWLVTILKRNIVDAYRHHTGQKRDLRREEEAFVSNGSAVVPWRSLMDDGVSPSSVFLQGETALMLVAAMTELNPQQATAIRMRYMESCKVNEIAEHLDCTVRTVSRLIRRGLEELRRNMCEVR